MTPPHLENGFTAHRATVGGNSARRPITNGAAMMWSREGSGVRSDFPFRIAKTCTVAHAQPGVRVLVLGDGFPQKPKRTGSTIPRTASTM
jgi:hypothetical protein